MDKWEKERIHKRKWYKENKEISLERVSKYKSKNPEKVKERQARYRKLHPDKLWIGAAKQRAKTNGIEFSITEKDVPIPDFCPILGIPLFRVGGGKSTANSPSIDRIDPTKGYVSGNVQVLSNKANILKNYANLGELILLGEWAKLELLERE